MKKKAILFSSIGGAALIAVIILIICLCLPKGNAYRTINVQSVTGTVNVKRKGDIIDAKGNMKLKNEDVVEVKESSNTILKLDSDKFVMAKENTTFKLMATGKKNNTKTRIIVEDGGVIVEVKEKLKQDESFEIASANSVMAIRGTQIGFDVLKTTETFTTKLAILKGSTDVMLLNNNELKSTPLVMNQGLTYSTLLSNTKTTEEIATLLDTTTIGTINDEDLKTVYNTEKRELTTEEIDSIVDAVNSFERNEEEQVNGTIKFSNIPSEVEYGLDPKDFIEFDKEYENVKLYFSETIDGEYKLFDLENPLYLGNYYFKALGDDAYRSDPYAITIGKRKLTINFDVTQNNYMGTAQVDLALDKDIFSMLDFDKLAERGNNNEIKSKYEYYVQFEMNDLDGSKISWLDYKNPTITFDKVFEGAEYAEFHIFSNFPEYLEVTIDDIYKYNFEDSIDLSKTIVSCDDLGGSGYISIYPANYYYTAESNKLKAYLYDDATAGYVEVDNFDGTSGELGFYLEDIDQTILALGTEDLGQSKNRLFEIDTALSVNSESTTITVGYGSVNALITYNDDNETMNAYYDCKFTPATTNIDYIFAVYTDTFGGRISYVNIGSNNRFAVIEDIKIGDYEFDALSAVTLYNDVYYVVKNASIEYGHFQALHENYANFEVDYETGDISVYSTQNAFDVNSDIIINTSKGGQYILTDSEKDKTNHTFNSNPIENDGSDLYVTATVFTPLIYYGQDDDVLFELENNEIYFIHDEIWGTIVEQMEEKYGVTLKGFNKHLEENVHLTNV